jgi:hypothetical protein
MMAVQTRLVIRKLGNIRKGGFALSYFLPIIGGKGMTGITGQLFARNVCAVPKV